MSRSPCLASPVPKRGKACYSDPSTPLFCQQSSVLEADSILYELTNIITNPNEEEDFPLPIRTSLFDRIPSRPPTRHSTNPVVMDSTFQEINHVLCSQNQPVL